MQPPHLTEEEVFPAYAGMSLVASAPVVAPLSFPRLRGDEPKYADDTVYELAFSPPTRG